MAVILSDLLDIDFEVTRLVIECRSNERKFMHQFVFEKNPYINEFYRKEIEAGRYTVVDCRLNIYGRKTKNSFENAWAVNKKVIPKKLLEKEVDIMQQHSRRDGCELLVTVIMSEIELAAIPV